jgi:hypothetical protein
MKKKHPGVVHDFMNPVFIKGHMYKFRSEEDFSYENIDYRHMDNNQMKFFWFIRNIDGEETVEMESIVTKDLILTALDDTGCAYVCNSSGIARMPGYRFLFNIPEENRFEILYLEIFDVDMLEPV